MKIIEQEYDNGFVRMNARCMNDLIFENSYSTLNVITFWNFQKSGDYFSEKKNI